jgi:hypothetical protein
MYNNSLFDLHDSAKNAFKSACVVSWMRLPFLHYEQIVRIVVKDRINMLTRNYLRTGTETTLNSIAQQKISTLISTSREKTAS